MKFNKADKKDIPKLVLLRKAYLAEDYGNLTPEQLEDLGDNLPQYFEKHLGDDLIVYTARDNDEIVSCCFLLVIEKPANPSFPNGLIGNVLNVYTVPEHRNRRYAYTLMKCLLSDAKDMRLDFLELKSTESGYNLYKILGFGDETQNYKPMKLNLQ